MTATTITHVFVPESSGFYRIEADMEINGWVENVRDSSNNSALYSGADYELVGGKTYFVNVGPDKTGDVTLTVEKGKDFTKSAHMAYRYSSSGTLDIRGWDGENYIQTSDSNEGYYTVLRAVDEWGDEDTDKVGFSSDGIPAETSSGLTITPNLSFTDDGMFVIVSYVVKNPTDRTIPYSLGVNSEVMIAGDDSATVYATATGLKMESKTGVSYYLICNNVPGITEADSTWFGKYDGREENQFSDYTSLSLTGEDDSYLTFAFAWQNRSIAPGATQTYTYELGIGSTGSILAPENSVIADGNCGTSLLWNLNASGTLTIRGTGAMDNYEKGKAPWYS